MSSGVQWCVHYNLNILQFGDILCFECILSFEIFNLSKLYHNTNLDSYLYKLVSNFWKYRIRIDFKTDWPIFERLHSSKTFNFIFLIYFRETFKNDKPWFESGEELDEHNAMDEFIDLVEKMGITLTNQRSPVPSKEGIPGFCSFE